MSSSISVSNSNSSEVTKLFSNLKNSSDQKFVSKDKVTLAEVSISNDPLPPPPPPPTFHISYTNLTLSIASFFVLVFIQVSLALSFRAAQDETGKYPFDPAAVLVIAEVLKFLLSLTLYSRSENANKPEGWYVAFKSEIQSTPTLFYSCFALAVLYCANNNISFLLFQWMDGANINLFKSGSSFVSTLLLRFALHRGISSIQWAAVGLQVCGLAISQFGATGTNAPLLSASAYFVLLISLTITSICSVYNDKVLKDHANVASLHTVNALLYAVGATLNGLVYLFTSTTSEIIRPSFFSGFDRPFTWVVLFFNTVIGIVVSAVYKYADATIKTFASACATSALLLVNILIYNQDFKIVVVLACITVFIATYLYATNPVVTNQMPKSIATDSTISEVKVTTTSNVEERVNREISFIESTPWHLSIRLPWFLFFLIVSSSVFFFIGRGEIREGDGSIQSCFVSKALKLPFNTPGQLEKTSLSRFPFNVTLQIPGASNDLGKGNFALPSGRRITAIENAVLSLSVGTLCSLYVTVRTERKIESPIVVANAEIARSTLQGVLLNRIDNSSYTNVHQFFVIDTIYDSAFIHWVLESAVFLTYWSELKGTLPKLKLVLRQPRKYKSLFLPVFGIAPDDVVYYTGGWPSPGPREELPQFPHSYPEPNLVFIPPGQYLHDTLLNVDLFHQTLSTFVKHIKLYSSITEEPLTTFSPHRSVLVLPRGRKENYGPNERKIPELDILASLVEDSDVHGAEVLRSDEVNDIRHQVQAISRAKVIFVSAGSAAYFSMLFAVNSTIYVMGPDRLKLDSRFPYSRELCALASRTNSIIIRDDSIGKTELRTLLIKSI
jgi:hypothetical protein